MCLAVIIWLYHARTVPAVIYGWLSTASRHTGIKLSLSLSLYFLTAHHFYSINRKINTVSEYVHTSMQKPILQPNSAKPEDSSVYNKMVLCLTWLEKRSFCAHMLCCSLINEAWNPKGLKNVRHNWLTVPPEFSLLRHARILSDSRMLSIVITFMHLMPI